MKYETAVIALLIVIISIMVCAVYMGYQAYQALINKIQRGEQLFDVAGNLVSRLQAQTPAIKNFINSKILRK